MLGPFGPDQAELRGQAAQFRRPVTDGDGMRVAGRRIDQRGQGQRLAESRGLGRRGQRGQRRGLGDTRAGNLKQQGHQTEAQRRCKPRLRPAIPDPHHIGKGTAHRSNLAFRGTFTGARHIDCASDSTCWLVQQFPVRRLQTVELRPGCRQSACRLALSQTPTPGVITPFLRPSGTVAQGVCTRHSPSGVPADMRFA